MKKLINEPDAVVREALEGIEAAHGDHVRVIYEPMVIVRADAPIQGKVGIISGGGSGHEPMHGGFVGRGHARRRMPRRGLHVADARSDARGHQGRRRRRGRPPHRQELHGRRAQLRDGRRPRAGRGDRGRGGRDQRRRRGPGQPLHRRPARRRHHGDRGEDLRRRGRGAQVAGGGGRAVPQGQRPGSQHGDGAHALRDPGLRSAELRARRRRDGDRDRHPRRARPLPREAGARVRGRRPPGDGDRRGPAVRVRRPRARVRQRDGRHAADRALHRVPRARPLPRGSRHHDRAAPDRRLHHLARDGGLLDHAAQARRRADAAVGRAGRHARAAGCAEARGREHQRLGRPRLDRPLRGGRRRAPRRAGQARHGDRRRRPRDEHGPRHAQGGREARLARGRRHRRDPQGGRHGPRLERRRRRRAAVRDAVPADGDGERGPRGARPRRLGRCARGRAPRACSPAARPSRTTRR